MFVDHEYNHIVDYFIPENRKPKLIRKAKELSNKWLSSAKEIYLQDHIKKYLKCNGVNIYPTIFISDKDIVTTGKEIVSVHRKHGVIYWSPTEGFCSWYYEENRLPLRCSQEHYPINIDNFQPR